MRFIFEGNDNHNRIDFDFPSAIELSLSFTHPALICSRTHLLGQLPGRAARLRNSRVAAVLSAD